MKTLETLLRVNPALPLKAFSKRYAISTMAACGYHEWFLNRQEDLVEYHKAALTHTSEVWPVNWVPKHKYLTRFGSGRKDAKDHGGLVATIGLRISARALEHDAYDTVSEELYLNRMRLARKVFHRTVQAIDTWQHFVSYTLQPSEYKDTENEQALLERAIQLSETALPEWELQFTSSPAHAYTEAPDLLHAAIDTYAHCQRFWSEFLWEHMQLHGYETNEDYYTSTIPCPTEENVMPTTSLLCIDSTKTLFKFIGTITAEPVKERYKIAISYTNKAC